MLSDILLTVDSREKNQKRIKAVELWAISHGAAIEHGKLDECDYALQGTFNGHEINLGIEIKSMADFCGSWKELKERFTRAREIYTEVSLCVEAGNYTFSEDPETKKTIINNPRVQDGTADVCPLAVYEGLLDTLSFSGIHVRQLRSEYHFPYAIQNLLTYITNEHELIPQSKSYVNAYRRVLMSFEGIGWKGAEKLMKAYPNLHWLCSADPSAYETVLGKPGKRLGEFIRNHELETIDWRNGNHLDGTPRACEHCKDQGMYEEASIIKVCGFCTAGTELEAWWKACPAWFGKPLSFFRQRKDSNEGLKPFENIPTKVDVQKLRVVDGKDDLNAWEPKVGSNPTQPPLQLPGKGQQTQTPTLPVNTRCAESKDSASSQSSTIEQSKSVPTHSAREHLESEKQPPGEANPKKLDGHDTSGKETSTPLPDSQSSGNTLLDDSVEGATLIPLYSQPTLNASMSSNDDQQGAFLIPPPNPAVNSHTGNSFVNPPIPKPDDSPVQLAITGDIILRDVKPDDWKLSKKATPQAKKVAGVITEIENLDGYKMTLKEQIKEFFADGKGHSMQEVVDTFAGFDRGRVFDFVMGAHKAGYFRSYTQKGVRMFTLAVVPDKEMDVGV